MARHLAKVKERLFENIFNNAANGIAIVALDFRWVKVNQSLMDLLGYSEEEFYSMTFNDITHKADLEADMEQLGQLINGEIENYQIEKRYFHKTGRIIWVLLSVSMQVDEFGIPVYFISQIMEVTRRKQMVEELHTISEIMREQNDRLLDFAHIATHDIRSHVGNLEVITGFMEDDTPELAKDGNFRMLKEALGQLRTTIGHLNEVRKSELSALENLQQLNLSAYAENVIYNINAIARHEHCEIINDIEDDVEVMAMAGYLESIILNLLTNAIKYRSTERRSFVRLSARKEGRFIVLEVCDNGLGMDLKKNRNRLFQLEQTFHNHPDARGVGLFITRNHVENMGGKIEVESELDIGSMFRVYFQCPKK